MRRIGAWRVVGLLGGVLGGVVDVVVDVVVGVVAGVVAGGAVIRPVADRGAGVGAETTGRDWRRCGWRIGRHARDLRFSRRPRAECRAVLERVLACALAFGGLALAAGALGGCGRMIPPEELALGTKRVFQPVRRIERSPAQTDDAGQPRTPGGEAAPGDAPAAAAPATRAESEAIASAIGGSSVEDVGRFLLALQLEVLESGQGHPVQHDVFWPMEDGRPVVPDSIRGIGLVIPGILGRESARTLVASLGQDGWIIVVAWPPLVDRVRDAWEAHRASTPRERGRAIGAVVDRTVQATALSFGFALPMLFDATPALQGKPVLLIGESLGAIVGVGVAASGRLPFDAAIFVAGGGGFCDIVRRSAIRGLVFGARDFDDGEFVAGFEEACGSDPLRAAERLRGAPVVVITADDDAIVPASTQSALWRALGEPPRYRWTGGHLSLFSLSPFTIVPTMREVAAAIGPRTRSYERYFESGGVDPRDSGGPATASVPPDGPADGP